MKQKLHRLPIRPTKSVDTAIEPRLIAVRGAREHNLDDVDIDLPRDQLVVLTGLSGSGKSSLAFDTIYAEGQRRYVESLSAYARQFLDMMNKPDVDLIEGLSPAISIEQKTTSRNPRSTVGTVTEIYDYMRLLWARIGIPYSPATGLPIRSQTVSQMVEILLDLDEGTRLYLLAPIVRGRKGEYRKELSELNRKGFSRVRINGDIYDVDDTPSLDKQKKHNIEVVVDRVVITDDLDELATRLADSLETALGLSDGLVFSDLADKDQRIVFSARFACPESGFTIDEIEPRLFSFNNPMALARRAMVSVSAVILMNSLSCQTGKLVSETERWRPGLRTVRVIISKHSESLAKQFKFSLDLPFSELDADVQSIILYGSGKVPVTMEFDDGIRSYRTTKPFEGVIPNLARRYRETDSSWVRDELEKFRGNQPCNSCNGKRLKMKR